MNDVVHEFVSLREVSSDGKEGSWRDASTRESSDRDMSGREVSGRGVSGTEMFKSEISGREVSRKDVSGGEVEVHVSFRVRQLSRVLVDGKGIFLVLLGV